jgi:hypothetical protein
MSTLTTKLEEGVPKVPNLESPSPEPSPRTRPTVTQQQLEVETLLDLNSPIPLSLVGPEDTCYGGVDTRDHPSEDSMNGDHPSHDEWVKRRYHHWKTPLLMSISFAVGIGFSIAHCTFYKALNGKLVGGPRQQENNIR